MQKRRFLLMPLLVCSILLVALGCNGGSRNINPSAKCSDSDLGLNLSSFGYATVSDGGISTTFSDHCASSTMLLEYSCSSDLHYSKNSLIACPPNQVCSDGECRPSNVVECSETDMQIDIANPGQNTIKLADDQNLVLNDECLNDNFVKEYYCNLGSSYSYKKVKCPGKCVNGSCDSSEDFCADSDGSNIEKYGEVVMNLKAGGSLLYPDFCVNETYVSEQICQNDKTQSSMVLPCTLGGSCNGGQCFNAGQSNDECEDTDGGRNYGESGYLVFLNQSGGFLLFEDKCISSTELLEYYCIGSKYFSETITCPNGKLCNPVNKSCS
ncbi:MAG: hypothetical protein AABX51_01125 [Nanoarchaeota archaeon]